MKITYYMIGVLLLIIGFSALISRYFYKKGQIKMSNEEISSENVDFNSSDIFKISY